MNQRNTFKLAIVILLASLVCCIDDESSITDAGTSAEDQETESDNESATDDEGIADDLDDSEESSEDETEQDSDEDTEDNVAACDDGIQNQDETGIDCGGVCDVCDVEASCIDDVRNGLEIGIDCGGSCEACSGDGVIQLLGLDESSGFYLHMYALNGEGVVIAYEYDDLGGVRNATHRGYDEIPLGYLALFLDSDILGIAQEDGGLVYSGNLEVADYLPENVFVKAVSDTYYGCGLTRESTVICWDAKEAFDEITDETQDIVVREGELCRVTAAGDVVCSDIKEGTTLNYGRVGTFAQVDVNDDMVCARDVAGQISCWGRDTTGEIMEAQGDSAYVDFNLADHGDIFCGITTSGALRCHDIGDADDMEQVPEGIFTQVEVASDALACAIGESGAVVCWKPTGAFSILEAPAF